MAKEKLSKSTREKAAAAREEQQAKEKRRERTVRIVGAIGVIVVVAVIIGLAVVVPRMSGSSDGGGATPLPSPNPSAAVPTGVYDATGEVPWGVPVGTAPATAPLLALWEDFQCPACGSLEEINGAGLQGLAQDGKVRLVWRPTTFLDNNLGNQASAFAVSAWGCAIDAGKTTDYHDTLYSNQPTTEGEGWTQEQLIQFGEQAGISGAPLDTFRQCVNDNTYLGWAVNSTQAFYDANIQGTPYGTLNGQPIETKVLADPAALEKAIADAVAGVPAPSPSGS
ncbi:MAG: DsbA family protein [Candidatus Nanopelagicales bacterium]